MITPKQTTNREIHEERSLLLFELYLARRAARLNPINTLRHGERTLPVGFNPIGQDQTLS